MFISRPAAKLIVVGLIVVLFLVMFQSWLSYNQGRTISALRCTVENQSDTLETQSMSLDELVTIRKRQDRFNALIRKLIIASREGDEAQVDAIIDEFVEEQAQDNAESGPSGETGPQGPQGEQGSTPTTPAPSPPPTTTTSSTTTTTRPFLTIPSLPPIIPIATSQQATCEQKEKTMQDETEVPGGAENGAPTPPSTPPEAPQVEEKVEEVTREEQSQSEDQGEKPETD